MTTRIAATVLLLLAACTQPPAAPVPPTTPKAPAPAARAPEAPPAPITTDQSLYRFAAGQFGPEVAIVSTFTAPADRDVYLSNCNGVIGPGLQRQVDGTWQSAWVVSMNACHSAPIRVPAGGRHSATLLIRPGAGAVVGSASDELPPGTYRVVWYGVYKTVNPAPPPFGEELPLEQRVSAPFTIAARE
jgi:hypothetical protein